MTALPAVSELQELGRSAGLVAVGVTSSDVLAPADTILPRRRSAGLAGTMQFTYRNPSRSTNPVNILTGARSVVTAALSYYQNPPTGPTWTIQGKVARYSWDDHYGRLRAGLDQLAQRLKDAGGQTRVVADSNALVDRNVAWRSGLGWYGKNTNLLIPGVGSWVVLGAIVTDLDLERSDQIVDDQCGGCSACLAACPTEAIIAPGVLDARRCLAWLVQAGEPIPVEYREAVGNRIYGCDDCQEICPPNRDATPVAFGSQPERAIVDIMWVLNAADDELLARCQSWYIADRNPDVIRRTALVIVGNVAHPTPEVVEVVGRYLDDDNPLLRQHAVWAARRLGLDELAAVAINDPAPEVRAELDATVAPLNGCGGDRG